MVLRTYNVHTSGRDSVLHNSVAAEKAVAASALTVCYNSYTGVYVLVSM